MSDPPFDVLLQQAVALKRSRAAPDRKRFDSWSPWYQHSLFAAEDIVQIRLQGDVRGSVLFAESLKLLGNGHYRDRLYLQAVNEYERSLSLLDWLEPLEENWRHDEIRDESLQQRRLQTRTSEEVEDVRQLKLANLLNLSACYLRMGRYSDCVLACSAVLELDGDNVKALFRRAQARSTAVSSGTTDHMKAVLDFKRAYSLSPGNREVARCYVDLKSSLAAQQQKDRRVLHNVFGREQGGKGGAGSNKERGDKRGMGPLTWYDAFVALRDMEATAIRLSTDGDERASAQAEARLAAFRLELKAQWPGNFDYAQRLVDEDPALEIDRQEAEAAATAFLSDGTFSATSLHSMLRHRLLIAVRHGEHMEVSQAMFTASVDLDSAGQLFDQEYSPLSSDCLVRVMPHLHRFMTLDLLALRRSAKTTAVVGDGHIIEMLRRKYNHCDPSEVTASYAAVIRTALWQPLLWTAVTGLTALWLAELVLRVVEVYGPPPVKETVLPTAAHMLHKLIAVNFSAS